MKRARGWLMLAVLLVTAFAPLAHPLPQPLSHRARGAAAPTPIASYQIQVTLDPATKTLRGHETLTYLNAARDALRELPFHLYLNAFRDNKTTFMRESGGCMRLDCFDDKYPGWIEVDTVRKDGVTLSPAFNDDRTVMTLTLASPLEPGTQAVIEFDFHAQLPKVFARTGYWEPDFFMVGQWFPEITVYDDRGWHAWPFHANAEFFADFGTYDVDITVPKRFVVGATGVRTKTQERGDLKTESYHAEDVIDFAWTASPRFKTATRRAGDVEIILLYQPENQRYIERYLKATEQSLAAYGEWYGPYPYSRITIVDPPSAASGAGGMEYPMLITAGVGMLGIPDLPGGLVHEAEVVVLHEMGHQWFYAVIATNEAEEPWMDEGMADFATVEAAARYYGAKTSLFNALGLGLGYYESRRLEYLLAPNVPMVGKAWEFKTFDYGIAAYSKPVMVLTTLKNILGQETFDRVMRTYAQRFRFKHPRTEDFIAVAQEVSGRDLKWFFDQALYGKCTFDVAVESVSIQPIGGQYQSTVVLARNGGCKFPVDLLVGFDDGSIQRQVWDSQPVSQTLTFETAAPLALATLDPDKKYAMEINPFDNSQTVEKQVTPLMRFASRWLFWMQAILDFGF